MNMTTTSYSDAKDKVTWYAKAVLSGEIVAGPHVRNACQRHLNDLKTAMDRGFFFDVGIAEWAIDYFPRKFRLSDGQFDGIKFVLDPSQAFIVGSLFGWLDEKGYRRFRRCFIEQGKGNGKSPLAAGIGLLGMLGCEEAGAQIYSAAAKREQAGILFQDAVKMVRKSKILSKHCHISGTHGKEFNIAHHRSSSFFRPVSRDTGKSGSGPRPYFILADEIHEMPSRDILEILERGFKFRREPLLFMITNSGTDRNSVAWEEHEFACRAAAGSPEPVDEDAAFVGEPIGDDTFAYVCALDKDDDPLEDPTCWIKANPLLGKTITEDYLASIVQQAKDMPSKLNNILRLHFCEWTDADVAWMTRKLLDPALDDFDPIADHKGDKLWIGMDLSQSRDITAIAMVVKTGSVDIWSDGPDGERVSVERPTYDAWIEAWTPGDTVKSRMESDRIPYDVWINGGFIHAPAGSTIPFVHVAQAIHELDRNFQLELAAYDRYAFVKFEEDAADVGLDVEFVEHPQGGIKKGKPTEAMKEAAEALDPPKKAEGLWMPGSVRMLEDALLEGRIRLRRNPVLISAMLSAVTMEDNYGNRWLHKPRSRNKIDAAIALCMAIGAAEALPNGTSGIDSWLEDMREKS